MSDSPKVSQSLHFTFRPNPEDRYTFAKLNLEIADIDTGAPFEEQQEKIDATVRATWKYVLGRIDDEIEQLKDLVTGDREIGDLLNDAGGGA